VEIQSNNEEKRMMEKKRQKGIKGKDRKQINGKKETKVLRRKRKNCLW
jgi:hypothetical protein